MRKFLPAALLAAFLLTGISGCYTKFDAPEPSYGQRSDSGGDYYYDDDYYYTGYGSCFGYYGYGWNGPFAYAYPYYSYNYFYSPWWYDPWYYYYGDRYSTRRSTKSVRNRRGNSGGYSAPSFTPAPAPPANPIVVRQPSPSQPSGISKGNTVKSKSTKSNKSSGKGIRKRR